MTDQRTAEAGSAKALHVRAAFARVLLIVCSRTLPITVSPVFGDSKSGVSESKDVKIWSKI